MTTMFINAIKGIEIPGFFTNVHAEYCTESEIKEYPEAENFVQYWADIDERNIKEAEAFCKENNFDFWY